MIALALALNLASPAFACDGHAAAAAATEGGEKKKCDMPTAETVAPVPAAGAHVALNVTGMHCGSCANTVHAALMKVDGVTGAQVDMTTGIVQVAYDAAKANPDKLLAAVTALSEFTVKLATN